MKRLFLILFLCFSFLKADIGFELNKNVSIKYYNFIKTYNGYKRINNLISRLISDKNFVNYADMFENRAKVSTLDILKRISGVFNSYKLKKEILQKRSLSFLDLSVKQIEKIEKYENNSLFNQKIKHINKILENMKKTHNVKGIRTIKRELYAILQKFTYDLETLKVNIKTINKLKRLNSLIRKNLN
jgi:hypothetical protein